MAFLPFAATVGGWMGATGATAAAVGGTAIATTALAGGMAAMTMAGSKQKMPAMPQLPETPKMKDAQSEALEETKKRAKAVARNKTIFTSPLGLKDEVDIKKKQLLGQ